MKNRYSVKHLAGILFVVLMVASCKKALEKSPLAQFDTRTFWTSEANAMLALTAVYRGDLVVNAGGQVPNSWWSYHALPFLEAATDNAYHGQGNNTTWHRLTNGTLTSNVAILSNFWTMSYKTIALSNDFLENIGKVPIDEAKRNRMTAEVRFIRACQYFYLSQHFGSVPLVTRVLSPDEANTVDKASHQELVDFVIAELTAAATDLPRFKDIPASETGRASKQAALAYLGRIQLAQKLFAEAANTYKTIIDFGDNIIDPDYASLFIEANENSKENIFSTQYITELFGSAVMGQLGPRVLISGFTLVNPSGGLMEAYQFTDGTPFSYTDARYDHRDLGKNRDPRLRYTIYYNGSPFKGTFVCTHPDSSTSVDRIGNLNSKTGLILKKYMDESYSGNMNRYGGNMPVIRYAEILLSYLEAKLEAGQSIDRALLDATINKVRGRASVNMPAITETNPTLLRPLLRNERRVELAMEGIRLWDLLRWGIAGEALNGDYFGAPFPGSKRAIPKKNAQAPADPYSRWYVTSRAFRVGVDEYWPIPLNEVNINPKLGQ